VAVGDRARRDGQAFVERNRTRELAVIRAWKSWLGFVFIMQFCLVGVKQCFFLCEFGCSGRTDERFMNLKLILENNSRQISK
jgi:hypothetical protein